MRCPVCGSEANRAVDSRPDDDCINRRRMCSDCGNRWNTIEIDTDQWNIMTSIYQKREQNQKTGGK